MFATWYFILLIVGISGVDASPVRVVTRENKLASTYGAAEANPCALSHTERYVNAM